MMTTALRPFNVSKADEDGLVRITATSHPLLPDPNTTATLLALEAEYEILWDFGPDIDEDGFLYYEAFSRRSGG